MEFGEYYRDLAPLSPREDPERWERLVATIVVAAGPALAGRRGAVRSPGALLLLSSWMRPALAAAAGLAAVAATVLVLEAPSPAAQAPAGLADALGAPAPVASWVDTGQTPSVDELEMAFGGVDR